MTSRARTTLAIVALLLAGIAALFLTSRMQVPGPTDVTRTSGLQEQAVVPEALVGTHADERVNAAGQTAAEPADQPTAATDQAPAPTAHAPREPGTSTMRVEDEERLVHVALRTPDGQAFRKAVDTGLFLPRAVATRESPDEKQPPPEGPRGCSERVLGRKDPGHGPEEGTIGVLRLSCEPPLWVSLMFGEDVLASQVLQPDQDEVVFVLDPREFAARQCTLRFRAVDALTGEPLTGAGAQVTCRGVFTSYPPVSDASFVIERLYPGPVSFSISGKEHVSTQRSVELEPGSDVDLGDIPFETLVRHPLRVTVRRPVGARDVFLHCEPLHFLTESAGPRALGVWHKDVGEEDSVRMRLTPDRWAIWVEGTDDDGALRSAMLAVEIEGGLTEATLELVRPIGVTLRNGPERAKVLARALDGLWARDPVFLAPDAELRIELVPGSYELFVRTEGEERVLPLQVGAQETAIDLR